MMIKTTTYSIRAYQTDRPKFIGEIEKLHFETDNPQVTFAEY